MGGGFPGLVPTVSVWLAGGGRVKTFGCSHNVSDTEYMEVSTAEQQQQQEERSVIHGGSVVSAPTDDGLDGGGGG